MSYKKLRQEFADTMLEVGVLDPRLVVLIGDISHFILQPFAAACPGRFYNVGICEPTIVNMAAGLTKVGLIPVVHTIAPFIVERAFEQIKLDFGYQRLGVNLITVGSAFDYVALGVSHHCYDDFALMKQVEDAQIIYPGSPVEFNALFKQTYDNGKITYFRVPEYQHGVEFDAGQIQFGKGIKVRDGKDLTLVAVGPQLKTGLEAVEGLEELGIDVEILYFPTIRPLDTALIRTSLKKTKRCLVIEEHSQFGGVYDDVLRSTVDISGVRYASLSIQSFIHQYGTYKEICDKLGLSVEGIMETAKKLITGH